MLPSYSRIVGHVLLFCAMKTTENNEMKVCARQDTLTKGKMITDLRSFFLKYEEITGFQDLNPI